MIASTAEELGRMGEAVELQLASVRPDGTLHPYVRMWVVWTGDDLHVRSAYGPDNAWFRRAKSSGAGLIRRGGLERDVSFAETFRACTAKSTRPTRRSTTGTDPRSREPSSAARLRRNDPTLDPSRIKTR